MGVNVGASGGIFPTLCVEFCLVSLCSCLRIIMMKFSGVITIDKSDVHARGKGQRSNVKVKTLFGRFRTVTLV